MLLVLCTFMVCFSFWSRCALVTPEKLYRDTGEWPTAPQVELNDFDQSVHFVNRNAKNYNAPANEMEVHSSSHELECEINKEYSVSCRREDDEVYLPFSFIQKYFEVYGEIQHKDGMEKFQFSHSYSLVHAPPDEIKPDGAFMSFEHYNVEIRKRVKCITATEGVPLSTQWELSGHFYPIQIAQFGLSHYSKYLSEGEPARSVLLSQESHLDLWESDGKSSIHSTVEETKNTQVFEISTQDVMANTGVYTHLQERSKFSLTLDMNIVSNGSISITMNSEGSTFHVHYVFSDNFISCDGRNIFYGLGENKRGKWIHLARDVDMDLLKGLALKCSKHRKVKDLTLIGITFRGQGWVDNVTIATAAHMDHFINAANWFVNHQDSRGGWPIMVTRKLIPDVMELPPGWYSAMAQGHAMSTLVRAYLRSKNPVYIKAAIDGLKLFEISSAQGGVKARFANTYDWYEEYPTTPSSFVLNGFIYSLFGLYDLKQIATDEALQTVTRLYNEGMKTLKAMLLMFDSGAGTFYDLRHVSVGLAPNRARWDYHTTHISQLLQLAKMDKDPLIVRTAKRWQDYMVGKRSPHN